MITIDEAGAIAVGLSKHLDAKEQAFFVAGFQEAIKMNITEHFRLGDLLRDEDGNEGIVVIRWNDGDLCAYENDCAHPNPTVIGHWAYPVDSTSTIAEIQIDGKWELEKEVMPCENG